MQRRPLILASAAALAGARAAAQPAAAEPGVELAGVRFPAALPVGGRTLQLNGAGIRYRFVVKVYAAALYLEAKAATTEGVFAAGGPRRIHVSMLREIDANDLGRLFTRGMQDNMPRELFARSIPGTLRMADIFSAKKRLAPGETFSVDWVPGQGTVVLVNGKPQGEPIREPEFYNALLGIWLGPNPADAQLKDALLGREAKAPPGSPAQQ